MKKVAYEEDPFLSGLVGRRGSRCGAGRLRRQRIKQFVDARGRADARARAHARGSHSFVKRDQFNLELNYGYQVTRGVVVTPNVEYIINPDTTQRPDAKFAPKNALVVGIRLTLNLDDALGIPGQLPRP